MCVGVKFLRTKAYTANIKVAMWLSYRKVMGLILVGSEHPGGEAIVSICVGLFYNIGTKLDMVESVRGAIQDGTRLVKLPCAQPSV